MDRKPYPTDLTEAQWRRIAPWAPKYTKREILNAILYVSRFLLQKKRWIVERTFGWLNRSRRLAKSFERTPASDTAFLQVARIHLMVKRLA